MTGSVTTKYIIGGEPFSTDDVASFIDSGMRVASQAIGVDDHTFLWNSPKEALTEQPDLRPNPRVFSVTIVEVQQTH